MPIPTQDWKEIDSRFARLETIRQVLKDRKFRKAVDKLDESLELRKQVAANPSKYFKGEGVVLPRGMTFTLIPDNWSITGCAKGVCVTIKKAGGKFSVTVTF